MSVRHCVLLALAASGWTAADLSAKEAKVARLSEEEIARRARARLRRLPKDIPKRDRENLYRLIAYQLRQQHRRQAGAIRFRGVGSGRARRAVDFCALYEHVSRVTSRGFAGKVIGLTAALAEPGSSDTSAGPLGLSCDIEVRPAGADFARPIRDGEILRDSIGPDGRGDKYRLLFRVDAPCYVYIVQLDVIGRFFPLYPSALFGSGDAFGRRVQPHAEYSAPPALGAAPRYFYLDRSRGLESIYILASRRRRLDIENFFHYFENEARRPARGLSEPLPDAARPLLSRGVLGVTGPDRPAAGRPTRPPKFYRVKSGDVLITRWFDHR